MYASVHVGVVPLRLSNITLLVTDGKHRACSRLAMWKTFNRNISARICKPMARVNRGKDQRSAHSFEDWMTQMVGIASMTQPVYLTRVARRYHGVFHDKSKVTHHVHTIRFSRSYCQFWSTGNGSTDHQGISIHTECVSIPEPSARTLILHLSSSVVS